MKFLRHPGVQDAVKRDIKVRKQKVNICCWWLMALECWWCSGVTKKSIKRYQWKFLTSLVVRSQCWLICWCFMGKVNTEGKNWVIFLQNMSTASMHFVVEGQRGKRTWKCFLESSGPSSEFYRYCLSHLC